MDLIAQIDSLTEKQLVELATREDAAGILAEYQLVKLRGGEMPKRETVVIGDGYAIVAAQGAVNRVELDGLAKMIRQEGDQFCVYSTDGTDLFGCYGTMAEAEERLEQMHYFGVDGLDKAREGSFVSWDSSGGRARGKIQSVHSEGSIKVPGTDYKINAEEDDPAVLIRVWRKGSDGWAETETVVGHKMSTLTPIDPLSKKSFKPPKGVQEAGQRALDWIAEGHAGSGFTDVGRARAAQLARGQNVSRETIGRMASYLARHQTDSNAEGFNFGEDGFPSPGRVAYDAWGGDAGKSWADKIMRQEENKESCPISTSDVSVNIKNRATAIEVAGYGPLNPDEPNVEYWEHMSEYFDVTPEEAQTTVCGNCAAFDQTTHMLDCISEGMSGESDPYDVIDAGDIGYCRIFKFKCASARTCSAWIHGGPITDEEPVDQLEKARFVRKADDRQFTLGPLYVPDFMDAHGEWTDPDTLQLAVWGWVNSGDRRIFLQHDRDVEAGEWVEVMTMPQPWTVEMMDSEGNVAGEVTYPTGTVFLGVIWNDKTWKKIKNGELRGYSIGGMSGSVYAEMPDDAIREGLEVAEKTSKELHPSNQPSTIDMITAGVVAAMKQSQNTVNVVMPEARSKKRRIERDADGNISAIIEEDSE